MLTLCDRFGVLPTQVRAEGTGLLRLIALDHAVKAVAGGG